MLQHRRVSVRALAAMALLALAIAMLPLTWHHFSDVCAQKCTTPGPLIHTDTGLDHAGSMPPIVLAIGALVAGVLAFTRRKHRGLAIAALSAVVVATLPTVASAVLAHVITVDSESTAAASVFGAATIGAFILSLLLVIRPQPRALRS